jgi:hypothetical protein
MEGEWEYNRGSELIRSSLCTCGIINMSPFHHANSKLKTIENDISCFLLNYHGITHTFLRKCPPFPLKQVCPR